MRGGGLGLSLGGTAGELPDLGNQGAADALLGRLEGLHAPVWLLLAYVVVLGTVVPFVLMITALHHIPATRATVVAMLEPVLAAVVAFAWLGERLGALQILGGLLVLAGIVLGQTARNES